MSGAANEYVFECRLAYGKRFDLSGKSFDNFRYETVGAFALDAHLLPQNRGVDVKAGPDALSQGSRVLGRLQHYDVAADLALQILRRAQRHQIAFIHDRQPVATYPFFH